MSSFLNRFLVFAGRVAAAERGFVTDTGLNYIDRVNLSDATLQEERFSKVAAKVMQESLEKGTVVITNNVIIDPEQAPVTNTSFSDLRMVAAVPLGGIGILYLDRPIKLGIISRDVLERIMAFGNRLIETEQTELDVPTMEALFSDEG